VKVVGEREPSMSESLDASDEIYSFDGRGAAGRKSGKLREKAAVSRYRQVVAVSKPSTRE